MQGKHMQPEASRFARAPAWAGRSLPVPPLRHVLFGLALLSGLLITLFQFTLPALHAFAAIFPQLAELWSEVGNRGHIAWLGIKAVAPLLWLLMLALVYWLWRLLTDLLREEAEAGSARAVTGHSIAPEATSRAPLPRAKHTVPPSSRKKVPPSRGRAVQRRTRYLQGRQPLRRARHPLSQLTTTTHDPTTHDLQVHAAAPPSPVVRSSGAENVPQENVPQMTPSPIYVSIRLLYEVSVSVHNPATGQEAKVPMQANYRRRELLAYFAWQRRKTIQRTTILHEVFQPYLPAEPEEGVDEAAKVGANFGAAVKNLRNDINTVAATIGLPRLEVVEHEKKGGVWWLAPYCRVIDLDEIEDQHRLIQAAILEQNVETTEFRDACDRLIAAYRGDFLEKHVERAEFGTDPSCWVRDPFTLYRDYYLSALWMRAEYETAAGEKAVGEDEQARMRAARACFARAGHFYEQYALHAPNTRFDKKVYVREPGERIHTSERALRRALEMYGYCQNIQAVDALFAKYKKALLKIFPPGTPWIPSARTEEVLALARAQTRTHRLQTRTLSPEAEGEDAGKPAL